MELESFVEFRSSLQLRERLFEYGFKKLFSDGDVIVNEQSYIKAIPIVMEGTIKVVRTEEDGRELLLYYINAGESCIMSFLGGMHQDTSKVKAIVEGRCEILFIPIEKVISLIREFPEWLDYIFKLYHKRFEELLEVVNAVAFKKLDYRLLSLLEKKAKLADSSTLKLTHEQLSNELGTSRVVVSRLLKQMESENLISLGRNNITLINNKV